RPPRVTGYLATVSVRARVRDLTALGGTLDAVVAAGANRLDGLRFGFANAEGLEDAARADAVADARRKAALMAAAADVSLGPILQLSEGGATARPPAPAVQFEAARASATPIARGESEIRATARIVYAIK
ncbi:MAG: SIMPL domain-containing protein, partial [Pseudomonadota bacterium]